MKTRAVVSVEEPKNIPPDKRTGRTEKEKKEYLFQTSSITRFRHRLWPAKAHAKKRHKKKANVIEHE